MSVIESDGNAQAVPEPVSSSLHPGEIFLGCVAGIGVLLSLTSQRILFISTRHKTIDKPPQVSVEHGPAARTIRIRPAGVRIRGIAIGVVGLSVAAGVWILLPQDILQLFLLAVTLAATFLLLIDALLLHPRRIGMQLRADGQKWVFEFPAGARHSLKLLIGELEELVRGAEAEGASADAHAETREGV